MILGPGLDQEPSILRSPARGYVDCWCLFDLSTQLDGNLNWAKIPLSTASEYNRTNSGLLRSSRESTAYSNLEPFNMGRRNHCRLTVGPRKDKNNTFRLYAWLYMAKVYSRRQTILTYTLTCEDCPQQGAIFNAAAIHTTSHRWGCQASVWPKVTSPVRCGQRNRDGVAPGGKQWVHDAAGKATVGEYGTILTKWRCKYAVDSHSIWQECEYPWNPLLNSTNKAFANSLSVSIDVSRLINFVLPYSLFSVNKGWLAVGMLCALSWWDHS